MQSVPEVASLSEQQSYQLYVQASKPTQPEYDDANLRNSIGADLEDHVLSEDDRSSNNSCDHQLGRRRVSYSLLEVCEDDQLMSSFSL